MAGVPQGSLGPLLWILYYNDILDGLECEVHFVELRSTKMKHFLLPDSLSGRCVKFQCLEQVFPIKGSEKGTRNGRLQKETTKDVFIWAGA